jgi:two-component system OmpR family response regulator
MRHVPFMNSTELPVEQYGRSLLSVLLVEDSEVLAERLREALTALEGVRVIATVDNESAATACVRTQVVDVIVLDLQLKRGTGFGVLRGLGAQRPTVVVLTNYALPEYREYAQRLGADHFLNKSSDYEQLADVIGSLRDARAH